MSRDRDRRRNWPRTERRQKVSDAKSKKRVQSALQNTVGRVSRSRDLFLFGLRLSLHWLISPSKKKKKKKKNFDWHGQLWCIIQINTLNLFNFHVCLHELPSFCCNWEDKFQVFRENLRIAPNRVFFFWRICLLNDKGVSAWSANGLSLSLSRFRP